MSTTLRTFHDAILALKPEDAADHVAADCPVCSGPEEVASDTTPGGTQVTDTKTYEAEYKEASDKVAALEAQVAELSKAREAEEIDSKLAEVKAEAEAQVADLQSKLDAATLEAATAKEAHEAFVKEIEDFQAAEAAAEAFETAKAERIAAVKEAAPALPDEYLTENADRFAKMDEESFQASLEGFKAIASKTPVKAGEIPATTAMTAARTTSDETSGNPLRDVLSLRFSGVDTRTIN